MVDVVRLLYGDDRPKGLLNERIFHPHFEVLRTMKEKSRPPPFCYEYVFLYKQRRVCVVRGSESDWIDDGIRDMDS